MSTADTFYAEIFNYSGISIGFGNVFPELRTYHHQHLDSDELLVSLHAFSDAPVSILFKLSLNCHIANYCRF